MYMLMNIENLNLTSGNYPIYWKRLCQQSNRTFVCSITIPFQKCLASGSRRL